MNSDSSEEGADSSPLLPEGERRQREFSISLGFHPGSMAANLHGYQGNHMTKKEISKYLVDVTTFPSDSSSQGVSPVVRESPDSVTLRRPLSYGSLNTVGEERRLSEAHNATLNRYKYYNKLSSQGGPDLTNTLMMPNHVVPPEFFLVIPIKPEGGKQHSLITIFSIWNTMMGTSLLSMPWALSMAGFACGLVIMVFMAGLTLYTAYRVMNSTRMTAAESEMLEFSDVCRYYLGRWGEYGSVVFSVIALLGAAIVYWVLMTNFFYHTVTFIYEDVQHEFNTSAASVIGNISYTDAFCPGGSPFGPLPTPSTVAPVTVSDSHIAFLNGIASTKSYSTFHKVWDQKLTVPFFLIVILLPLINFKSPTFFTKFNALGTACVLYILVFVIVKASRWGFHLNFSDISSVWYVPEYRHTFPALTGTLSLAYFIHNCVISIVRNQRYPEKNGRDLSIAYVCVACTYIFVGGIFYSSFPLQKACIEDNLLNNFRDSDVLAFVARICLFFQMITVFPLLAYIMRTQVLYTIFGTIYPSLKHVVVLNLTLITCCILFAVFLPEIGTIIRFSGALCGLVYIFTLPCLIYILSRKEQGTLTVPILVVHVALIALGVLNFIGQFIIL